ncbi:MAG: putative membrane protein [Cenarchaeum symbiont of Oopsacas minuta]|nr:putative membrane protein [Cenarchaeum symbiont of Oopsacas minuta]
MFVGFVASFILTTVISHYASDEEHHINATVTVAADYTTYIGVFSFVYFLLRHNAYKDSIRRDILKLVTSMGIAEIVYAVMRWTTHYYLLELGYDPYMASVISHLCSTAVYFTVANIAAKITGLFKRK